MDHFREKIAEGLRSLRVKKNYSQEYVADRLGKNDYTGYQRIETGRTELKFEDAYKLARLYKVPMEHIFNPDLKNRDEKESIDQIHDLNYKKNLIQVTVNLDGTDDFLEHQIELLRGMNKVISGF
jgi:transcriptional regulator with XRE-family HTH domain